MISLADAVTLALTKLRIRRVRTVMTVLIASMLFGVIAFATFVLQGGVDSVRQFSAGSLSDRYLAQVTFTSQISYANPAPSVSARATELYNKLVADKKAAAKKLGIEYDPTSEPKPVVKYPAGDYLNNESPLAKQALDEYIATLPSASQKLHDITAPFRPTKIYPITHSTMAGGQSKPLVSSAEDFTKFPTPSGGGNDELSFGWSFLDEAVVKAFMLPDTQLARQKNVRDIPVIAPITKVEEALGLKPLSNAATTDEKLQRIRTIRDNADKATFTLCYRNGASQVQIDSAISVAKEIEQNKANKLYQKPALMYGLPAADACAAAPVIRDARTADEKVLDGKRAEFTRQFSKDTEPFQQKVTFRVVGLSPNRVMGTTALSGVESLVSTIAGSTLDGRWVVPQQLYDTLPNKQDFARFAPGAGQSDSLLSGSGQIIAEFANTQDVKSLVTKMGCGTPYCDGELSVTYFGSNSVLVDDLRTQAVNMLVYAALGIGLIASVIMMGMTGRVIGDSRRETAVFRAIGAKRKDIRLIYVSYTIALAAIIVVVSLALGALAALAVDTWFTPQITAQAHLTYIFANDVLRIHALGIWWQGLAVLVALIMLTALVGMSLPLARNLRRSPIKDMRDDT